MQIWVCLYVFNDAGTSEESEQVKDMGRRQF